MSVAVLIHNMAADGLRLSVTPAGKIKAAGDQATINRWISVLKTRQAEIITALVAADFQDAFEERASIMEFDAGLPCDPFAGSFWLSVNAIEPSEFWQTVTLSLPVFFPMKLTV